MEDWIEIEDFPSYEVSSHGRVRNRSTGRVLLESRHPRTGLLMVFLRRDLKQHTRTIHKLVAAAHLYPGPHGCVPIHLDGNRDNNRADNLDWKPLPFARELTEERGRDRPIDPRRVRFIEKEKVYTNALEAARDLGGLEKLVLSACRSNGAMSYRGGHWAFDQ